MKTREELAAEQAAYWKGVGGTMWLGAYDRIQRGIAGFSEVVLRAADAQPGERVLDVGCGTGGTTAALATAVGDRGRALKPSGRLVFLCWRTPAENPWGAVPMRAAQPFLPPMARPGPEDPGQYSFGDRTRVGRILAQAGFHGVSIEPVDLMMNQGRDVPDVLARIGDFGPLARAFREVAPDQIAKAKAAIAAALEPHATADGVQLAGACWLVRARP
jgi:SAM-dependent methyltransferase